MHNSKPAVSVIIPAYNSAKFIDEAIKSVLAQTYPVYEIIVVDDGSTDDTRKIVTQYSILNTQCIKYIYQSNKGPAAARNNGIRAAKGEYIAFLDSDDIWMPDKIMMQIKKIEENSEYPLGHTNRIRIGTDGMVKPMKNAYIPEGFIFNELLMGNFICTSTILIKKSCFDEIGLFNENKDISEDYDMWLRMANSYKFSFIDKPLIKYRINQNGYCRSNIKISYKREEAAFLNALKLYKGNKEKIKNERLHNLFYRMGNSLFYIKDYKCASLAFWQACRLRKLDISAIGKCLFSKLLMNLSRGV